MFPEIRFSQALSAVFGVVLADLVICHLIMPNLLKAKGFTLKTKGNCCQECPAGRACKTVRGPAQVADADTFNRYRMLSAGRPESAA